MVVETNLKSLANTPQENLFAGSVLVRRPNFEVLSVEVGMSNVYSPFFIIFLGKF